MSEGKRLLDLKYKLMTIEMLNLAKSNYTYRQLTQLIGLPETVLSRYVKGHVLPTRERAEEMNKILQKILKLDKELQKRIKLDEYGFFDNTKIIGDPLLMEKAVQHGINKFAGKRVTLVLTAAVDGIPLATLMAHRLEARLAIAKKYKEVGVRDWLEEMYIPQGTPTITSLYVPRGIIKKGDGVLIVDDVVDSGDSQKALIKMVQRARASVTGIYGLIAIGDEWKEKLEARFPIEIILQVSKKR